MFPFLSLHHSFFCLNIPLWVYYEGHLTLLSGCMHECLCNVLKREGKAMWSTYIAWSIEVYSVPNYLLMRCWQLAESFSVNVYYISCNKNVFTVLVYDNKPVIGKIQLGNSNIYICTCIQYTITNNELCIFFSMNVFQVSQTIYIHKICMYIKQIQMKWTVKYFQISIAQSPQLPTEMWEEMGREDSVRYMWVWINLTLG